MISHRPIFYVRKSWLFHIVDLSLQILQESARMGSVHLGMVELEGYGQVIFKSFLPVFSPDDKGIIEDAAVHADSTVYFCIDDGRSAYYHTGCG